MLVFLPIQFIFIFLILWEFLQINQMNIPEEVSIIHDSMQTKEDYGLE